MNDTTQLTLEQLAGLATTDLLDLSFDEIPDAPEFVNPPEGIYLVDLKISQDTYDRKIYKDRIDTGETVEDFRFSVNCVITDVLDVQPKALHDGEEVPRVGDRFNNRYFGKGGLNGLVSDCRELAKALGVTSVATFLETLANNPVSCVVALKRTTRKSEGETYYGVKFESITMNQ